MTPRGASPRKQPKQVRRSTVPGFRDRAPERHRRGENGAMPKNKSHSGASKRFKVTGSGKVLRERAASATCSSTSRPA
ncbi:hypothetical protein GCM10019016_108320 [Streptomyces prasinosporus]|uniref:50S ribosomal protein L35 n=1 Tax=Streptomyces prasinosporus TaxID=68256 RepID=A0ABP6U7N0_9ACTN